MWDSWQLLSASAQPTFAGWLSPLGPVAIAASGLYRDHLAPDSSWWFAKLCKRFASCRGGQTPCPQLLVTFSPPHCGAAWARLSLPSDHSQRMQLPGGLPWCLSSKESTCRCRRCGFDPWVRKIPLEEEMATPSSILAREVTQREEPGSLASPFGHKESDTTEHAGSGQGEASGILPALWPRRCGPAYRHPPSTSRREPTTWYTAHSFGRRSS